MILQNEQSKQDNQQTIKDEILLVLSKQPVIPESYVKIVTAIPNFQPIYQYYIEKKVVDPSQDSRLTKQYRNSMEKITMQQTFRFGSQIYLKLKPEEVFLKSNQNVNHKRNSVPTIQKVTRIYNDLLPSFIFFEILMRDQFLTQKQEKQIVLCNQESNESIWVVEKVGKASNYRLFNISCNKYLCQSIQEGQEGEKIYFSLTKDETDPAIMFSLIKQSSNEYFTLSSLSSFQSKNKSSSPKSKQTRRVQLIPVENSVVSLFYELKLAQQVLKAVPSFSFLHYFIEDLIYYNLPQFGESEGLLSVPIQKLLAETGLSQKIADYLISQVDRSQKTEEINKIIKKQIRLLCLSSRENSVIFIRLITKLLNSIYFDTYLEGITQLVKGNLYFMNSFQLRGWYQIIFRKLQQSYSNGMFQQFYRLAKLIGEFCQGSFSMGNKYLVMHTLQEIYDETEKRKGEEEQSEKNSFWLKIFQEGQYVFVEMQVENKLNEVQLQTFLHLNQSNRFIYMSQMALITSLCSGFNLNAINRYYHILKSVSSYCYNENFPYFKNPQCREITIQSISTCLDWDNQSRRLQSKYNIGVVFIDQQSEGNIKNRQKNFSKNKLQLIKNNRNFPENQSLTGVFRHLVSAFQNYMISLFKQVDEFNLIELILSENRIRDKLGGKLQHWIKIIQTALDTRLIKMLKKKPGPYTQYFAKIFQSAKKVTDKQKSSEKERSETPSKKLKKRGSSPSNFPFVVDKEYETEANIILDLVVRLVKYNPIYQEYLKMRKVDIGQKNRLNFMDRMLNLRKSYSFFRDSRSEAKSSFQSINKVIAMDEILNQTKNYQNLYPLKLNCFRVLSLIYQNIFEEHVQYEIKTLSYISQGSKFVNDFTLEEGFRKLPFTDDNFRSRLLQNWYMYSNPQILQEVTTVIRYVYDQQQIYLRLLNSTIALFQKEQKQFYDDVQPSLSQAHKLSMCVSSWLIPQILKSSSAYQDNYYMLLKCLQSFNAHIKKLNETDYFQLLEYQEIIQNLKVLDVFYNMFSHLNKIQSKSNRKKGSRQGEYFDSAKEFSQIFSQLTKMVQFFVHLNVRNKCKMIICLSDLITGSINTLSILFYIIKDPYNMQRFVSLLTSTSIKNLIYLLPSSCQFLEIVLRTNDFLFVKTVQKIGQFVAEKGEGAHSIQLQEKIIKSQSCFLLICKIVFRINQISNCCSIFLKWFYDNLLQIYLERVALSNPHFNSKTIENISTVQIQLSSSIAFLLFFFFKRNQNNRQDSGAEKYGKVIKSLEGRKLLNNYIFIEAYAILLESDPNIILNYVAYYLYDLLPLFKLCTNDSLLKNEDFRLNMIRKCQEYLKIYSEREVKWEENEFLSQKKIKPKNILVEENTGFLFNYDKKYKQIVDLIERGHFSDNFKPRSKYVEPPEKPEVLKLGQSKKHNSINKERDEGDRLNKKATKLWYKARLKINENKQKYYIRQKWLEDVEKLSDRKESEKEKIINSNDIFAKTLSIIVNFNIINLSSENQIFLLKCCILWVSRSVAKKVKKQKKTAKQTLSMTASQESKYLVKNFDYQSVISGLMDQVHIKLISKDQSKNILLLCYHFKLGELLLKFNTEELSIHCKQKIVDKISLIVEILSQLLPIHLTLKQQYENSKLIDSWSVMDSWVPLKVFNEMVQMFLETNKLYDQQLETLAKSYLKSRLTIGAKNPITLELGYPKIFSILRELNKARLEFNEEMILSEEFFETLNILG